MLTPVSAATLGSAATAAQPTGDYPPPPPGPYAGQGVGHIPIGVLIGWLAMVALIIYLGTRGNHHHHPNSPA
jgi:hypothetical protein